MSIAGRQHTCAVCGGPLGGDVDLEVLVDDAVRWIAVHPGHRTTPAGLTEPTGAVVLRGPWNRGDAGPERRVA